MACDKEEPPIIEEDKDVITTTIDDVKFASNTESGSDTKTITFTTNKPWTTNLSETVSWVEYEPKSGDAGKASINITVQENETYDDRFVTLTIKTGNTTKDITIEQKQKDAILLGEEDYEVGDDGGTFDVVVQANVPIEVHIPEKTDWVRLLEDQTRALEDRVLTFEVDENNTPESRSTEITITNTEKGISQVITIAQDVNRFIVPEQTEYEVSSLGDRVIIYVETNVDKIVVDIPESAPWITITEEEAYNGRREAYISLDIDYNDSDEKIRSAEVTLRSEDGKVSTVVTITQVEMIFILPPHKEETIEKEGGTKIVEFYSNAVYKPIIPNDADWIQYVGVKDIDEEYNYIYYEFSVAPNPYDEGRDVTITFIYEEDDDEDNRAELYLYQYGHKAIVHIDTPGTLEEKLGPILFHDMDVIISGTLNEEDFEFFKRNEYRIDYLSLYDVTLPNNILPKRAFYQVKNINTYELPSTMTTFGEESFAYTEVGDIGVGGDLTTIEKGTFKGSTVESLFFPGRLTFVGDEAFAHCENLMTASLHDGVTSLGKRAFYGCTSLYYSPIPYSITTVPKECFSRSGLEYIDLHDKITKIEEEAFSNCTKVTEVKIPDSVIEIDTYAFGGCTSLETIMMSKNITTLGSYVFAEILSIENLYMRSADLPKVSAIDFGWSVDYREITLYVPIGSTEIYRNDFYWRGFKDIKEYKVE